MCSRSCCSNLAGQKGASPFVPKNAWPLLTPISYRRGDKQQRNANLGGLLVRGSHCRIENCIVHDVNWGGNISHPGVSLQGRSEEDNHNVVSRCTVYGVGNIGILYSGRASTIEYNHVYDTGRACRDIAPVHTGGARALGSVAHHNWVHGSTEIGLRGDDQTRGLTFHRNVVWNCRRGMIMKGNLNKVYHNTVLVDPQAAGATISLEA